MYKISHTRPPLLLLIAVAAACSPAKPVTPTTNASQAGIANPASVFCQQNGGFLELRQGSGGGVIGVCVFADGSECEEWSYFRGECRPAVNATTPRAVVTPSAAAGPPVVLEVLSPKDGEVASTREIQVSGKASPEAIVTVNDDIVIVKSDATFKSTVPLSADLNLIEVLASNESGSEAAVELSVTDQGGNLRARAVMVVPIEPVRAHRVGTVTAYEPGKSISILAPDGAAYAFILAATTKMLPEQLVGSLDVGSLVTVIAPTEAATLGRTAIGVVVHQPHH